MGVCGHGHVRMSMCGHGHVYIYGSGAVGVDVHTWACAHGHVRMGMYVYNTVYGGAVGVGWGQV